MSHADFVHLRVHSAYSLSEGALRTGQIADLCRDNRMPAVAITDTNNLFGALEFSQTCIKAGVQPIIGCQLSVREAPEPVGGIGAAPPLDAIPLYAKDETGYANLLKLVSSAFLEAPVGTAPHVPIEVLEAHAEGLILLTGGPAGPVGRLLANGQGAAAATLVDRLKASFGDRLYMEIARHGMDEERRIEAGLIELAYARDVPLVATNEAFFATEDMFEAHDALMCIAQGEYLGAPDRSRLTPDHRFKTAQEMRALFADLPEAVDNTLTIARRCAVMADTREPILPTFKTVGGRDEFEQLRADAEAGLERRMQTHVFREDMDAEERQRVQQQYKERLDLELGIIQGMGFPGYFLIVADFIQWAKGQ
ncbi:MAG: PHP domain-containing protein, partial [Bauldia litoralis]